MWQASISEQGVAVASKDFGGLTGVALNAGVFGPCYPMDNSPVDEFARGFAINVFSHLHTVSQDAFRQHDCRPIC